VYKGKPETNLGNRKAVSGFFFPNFYSRFFVGFCTKKIFTKDFRRVIYSSDNVIKAVRLEWSNE
jgi:hypothetical protein